MLDRDAYAARLTLSVGGWMGSTHMPLSVKELEEVSVEGGFGTRKVAGRAGYLGLVVGSSGSVDWRRIGDEVDPDALEVSGYEDAVFTFQLMLGAERASQGAGTWQLRGSEVLARSAWATDIAGLHEVGPVLLAPVRPLELAAFPVVPPQRSAVVLLGDVTPWAGAYRSESETLMLDTSGRFTLYRDACVSSTGRFRAEGGTVMLVPDQGPARPFRADGAALQGDSRFIPLEEVP